MQKHGTTKNVYYEVTLLCATLHKYLEKVPTFSQRRV